jgi:hypothetical protein
MTGGRGLRPFKAAVDMIWASASSHARDTPTPTTRRYKVVSGPWLPPPRAAPRMALRLAISAVHDGTRGSDLIAKPRPAGERAAP